jgi:hypothetical protein
MASRYERGNGTNTIFVSSRTHRGPVRHYATPRLTYPTMRERQRISAYAHYWKVSDTYWKLAEKAYGEPTYWWIIAWFNQIPTEAHLRPGLKIYIPTPLEDVLAIYENRRVR